MGYDIKNISEIDSIDFSLLDQEKETVRKSLDGMQFIISGASINKYTLQEIKVLINNNNWTNEPI